MRELSDDEVFGPSVQELSDDDVFGPAEPGFTDRLKTNLTQSAALIGRLTGILDAPEPKGSVMEDYAANQPFDFRSASMASRARDDMAERQANLGTIGPIQGPEPGVKSVLSGLVSDLVAGGKGARAGVRQMGGDLMDSEYLQEQARKERGQADLMQAMNTPEFESATARGIYGGVSSTLRQAPSIAAAIATRSPSVALGGMVAPIVPDEYGKFRQRGADPGLALLGATGVAGTEYLTERLPMGFLVNRLGRTGAGEFLTGLLAREIPGEQVATLVQDAIDTAVANPDKTWGEYVAERPDAAYQTLLATVTQAGIMGGANALGNRLNGQPEEAVPTSQDYQELAARVFGQPARPAATPTAPEAPQPPIAPEVVDNILSAIEQTQPTQPAAQPSVQPVQPPELSDADVFGEAETVTQPAASVATEEGAGGSQPLQVAPLQESENVQVLPQEFEGTQDQAPTLEAPAIQTDQAAIEQPAIEQPAVAGLPADGLANVEAAGVEIQSPLALNRGQQLTEAQPGMRPGDIVGLNGKPYSNEALAKSVATEAGKGWRVKRSNGGFVVRYQPATEKQIATAKANARRSGNVDSTRDNMFAAIAKLGGINKAQIESEWGIDPADLKTARGAGIKRVATSKGRSIDGMAEALADLGYLSKDENGRYDIREFEELFNDELNGNLHYTGEGFLNRAEAEQQQQYEDFLSEQDSKESGYDDLPEEAQDLIDQVLNDYEESTADEEARLEREAIQWANQLGPSVEPDDSDIPFDSIPEETNNRSAGQAVAQAPGEQAEDDFDLTGQTPEDIETQEAQRLEAQRQARDAEQRAQADNELNDFALTGSNRDVDRAEAAGQTSIFDGASNDRELQGFLDSGPVETQAGPAGEAAQRAAVSAVDDLRATETLLGLALSRDLSARQRASLVGQKVSSNEDLAVLAQVYRDPRFETFRAVFVNDQGTVISQMGLTTRLPASTVAIAGDETQFFNEMVATARNRGATGYYLLHNHPSGNAAPSRADERLTQQYAQATGAQLAFKGHVVIDTNEYAVIDREGRSELTQKDFGQPAPMTFGEWSGGKITQPSDVMAMAKKMAVDKGAVTLINLDNQLTVRGITTIPESAITTDKQQNRRTLIRAAMKQQSNRVIAVSHDLDVLKNMGDALTDAIYISDSGTVSSLAMMGVMGRNSGKLFPSQRRARVSPDTSPEFAYLRSRLESDQAQQASSVVREERLDYGAQPMQPAQASNNRDALGRVKFRLGEVAFAKLDAATRPIQERFGMRMASPELRKQLRQMKATIDQANRKAANVAEQMQKMPEADRQMVSDIVEQMLAPGVIPPEYAVKVADSITKTMDNQTDELVALGMLNPETAERWRGRYLPRIYNRKTELGEDTTMDMVKNLFRSGRPNMQGIGGGSLKGRGMFQEVSVDSVDQWLQMGYEVRDPNWKLKEGKLELNDPNAPVVSREKVIVWRDWTPSERAQMGENRDALFRFAQGYTNMQRDIALGRLFNDIANNPEFVRRSGSDGWVKVPDTDIPDTGGVKRYGKLAGLYVRKDVMSHLSRFEESANEALQIWREAMGLWKAGKTALNPVAHFNNIASNLSMAHFAGVSYWDGHKYVAAVRDLKNNAPMVDEAREAGLFTGSFTREELMQNLPPELVKLMDQDDSKLRKAGGQVMNALTYWLRKPMQNAYEFEDTFFKYLIYRDARNQGMEPQEATDYALRYIFTYDDLPSGARKVRDFALPFFSWTYKAIPAMLHTAMVYPWRFLAPAALLHGINLVAYALAAGDEDDDWLEKIAKGRELEKEERAALPDYRKGMSALGSPKSVRLGTDSVTGNPLFLDASRIIPGGDMFDMENQAGGLPIPAPLMPSHPVLSAFAAMIANKEMFMGREVVDRNDTATEAAEKRAKYMAGLMLPAIAPGGYHSQRILDATANAMDTVIETPLGDFTGVDKSGMPVQPGYAAMQTFGIKVRPTDIELEASRQNARDAAMIRSIAAEVRSMSRLYQRGAVSEGMMERTREEAREKIERMRDKED